MLLFGSLTGHQIFRANSSNVFQFNLSIIHFISTSVSAPNADRSALSACTLFVKLASGKLLMKLISGILHINVLSVEKFMEMKNRPMTASF